MNNNEDPPREYGARYHETATIVDLPLLAERILADLRDHLDVDGIPGGLETSIHVEQNRVLRLYVAGLPDKFIFASVGTGRYGDDANELILRFANLLDSYNWRNGYDLSDQRFKASVVLVSEYDHREPTWAPGVIREP